MPALRPLQRNRLYEDLVERLGEYVEEASMVPGDRFPPERDLAQQLGVSRTSVRTAMVVLQAQGFVDIRHGGGAFLRRRHDFGESLPQLLERRRRLPEVLEAREGLEVKLTTLASQRRTSGQIGSMRAALRRMRKDIAAGGLGIDGDRDFHQAVAEAAGNRILNHLLREFETEYETRVESLAEPGRPTRSIAAHQRILDAIEARDEDAAGKAMLEHLREAGDVSLLRGEPPSAGESNS